MGQGQGSPDFPKSNPPPAPITYAYPPYYCDTMATSYVQSLTSTPYYYFIPCYVYPSGYYYPSPRYAYSGSEMCFTRASIPNLGPPTSSSQSSYVPLKTCSIDNRLKSQEGDYGYERQGENSRKSTDIVERKNDKKSIDPRIINILEAFRQLYSEREESLKTILPGVYSKLSEFFKKVNSLISESIEANAEGSRHQTLKRSLSLGLSNCKNEWFKVRPIDSQDAVLVPPEGKKGDAQDAI